MSSASLQNTDSEIYAVLQREYARQQHTLEMIASENIASPAVMAAQGSVLTNKYAEGYAGRRYYGGCECVDEAEELALARLYRMYGADYANVQPHSGSQANMAAYFALLAPGDRILGMDLSHGGHLTHGSPVSFSGRLYQTAHYGVSATTGRIDYDALAEIARKTHPRMIIAGASAYPRRLEFDLFAQIAQATGALLLVDMAHIAGLVATGLHPSPVPHADVITSTTHKTLRGPRGGLILGRAAHAAKLNAQVFPGIQGGPLMHVIAAKAVAFKEALEPAFTLYQQQTLHNAQVLAEQLMAHGFKLVSDGTDNHLLLLDLRNMDITGKTAANALEQAGITVNKNTVPDDPQGPAVTSGIRIGTPALTTRGMQTQEMITIAQLIAQVLRQPESVSVIENTRRQVQALCSAFPLYATNHCGARDNPAASTGNPL